MAQPATINSRIFDETIRRKVKVLRFAEGEAHRVADALAEIEEDLLDQLGAALAKGKSTTRINSLIVSVRKLMRTGFADVLMEASDRLEVFGPKEAEFERMMLGKAAAELDLNFASVALETVTAATRSPIQGLQLRGWLDKVEASTKDRFERAIRVGVAQGETIDQIVARVRGTPEASYNNSVMAVSQREAMSLVRTAVAHVSNEAREVVWMANSDVVLCLRWTSVLDGRTTVMCMSRDGCLAPIRGLEGIDLGVDGPRLDPPLARPPGHWQCRSIMVAVLSAAGVIGNRPFVATKTHGRAKEAEIRALAKSEGIDLKDARKRWTMERVGSVPAKTTYGEWLRTQPNYVQDNFLGVKRAKLFREGMKLEKFIDFTGRKLRLDEL